MVRALPVSGVRVRLLEPSGEHELILLQRGPSPVATIFRLARELVVDGHGGALEWPALPAVDLAAAALLVRRAWLGERINTETLCPARGCGEPIDVSFLISDYLDHHRPRPFRGVAEREDGWFELGRSGVSFRIPTVEDALATAGDRVDERALTARCIRPGDAGPAVRRRVERALSAIAPRLDDQAVGVCPVCAETVELFFDPVEYVLAELRDASAGLYSDVHELASSYRWSEASILALDRQRRHSYVALIRGELALA